MLKTSTGNLLSPLLLKSDTQKDDLRVFRLGANDAKSVVALEISCRDQTAVLSLSAGILEKEPAFGKQEFLAEQDTVSLNLTNLSSGPFTAIYQHKEWWMRPAFCKGISQVPENTQLLFWKDNTTYYVLLAVCGQQCRADFSGKPNALVLSLSTNCAGKRSINDVAAVISCGENPYSTIREAVSTALKFAGKPYRLRENKPFPEIFEYLGWCSWDAFGHDVNEVDIHRKMEELCEKKIPVQWVLIDDGWSKVDFNSLMLFGLDADTKRFPKGLTETIRCLKEDYGIRWVGVWQAIMGYWNGIAPDSEAYREFSDYLEVLPSGKILPQAEEAAEFGFWNTWHRYLRRCGVDFVKVDSQSSISLFQTGRRTFGEASRAVHTGLEASAALNFSGSLINCMGMAPEDIWNRPEAVLSRNSDDFVPKAPHGMREHALQNAYNSLLHGNFYWEDWDMFWSGHEAAKQNAILRALSGGPIYLSEPIGDANPQYIFPLILNNGKILRCQDVGLPTLDCLFADPVKGKHPLKIFNRNGDNFAIGAFNISELNDSVHTSIGPSDIPALNEEFFWIYNWESRSAELIRKNEHIDIEIATDDAKLFLLLPKKHEVTVLGLIEKYISFSAIKEIQTIDSDLIIHLGQGGTFAFLSERKLTRVTLDGVLAELTIRGCLHLVECPIQGEHLIRIHDTEN